MADSARKCGVKVDRGYGFKRGRASACGNKSMLAVRTALQTHNKSSAATTIHQRSVSSCVWALCVTGTCTAHERRAVGYVKRDLCRGGSVPVPKARS
jgi:hypothetical protein